ncbi:MAG: tetratricopeptide repeat protein [Halanaerobiaceae bacterium]
MVAGTKNFFQFYHIIQLVFFLSFLCTEISILFNENYNNLNLKGLIYLKQNKYDKSYSCLKKSLNKGDNFEGYLGLAEIYHQKDKFQKAIKYCKKALQFSNKDNKYACFLLALLYYKMEDYNKAEEILLNLQVEFWLQAKVLLIKIYLENKKINKAKKVINEMLNENEYKDIGKYFLAYYHFEQNNLEKAKKILNNLTISYDPENLKSKINLSGAGRNKMR